MKVTTWHNISFDQMSVKMEWELVCQTLLWNYWEGSIVTDIPILDTSLTKTKARTLRWSKARPKVEYDACSKYLCDYHGNNLLAGKIQEALSMKENEL